MSVGPLDGGGDNQDVELNLAPILDAFTVLITFMLVSASFLSIGILDAGIAAPSANAAKDSKPPAVTVTVHLNKNYQASVKIEGKENRTHRVRSKDGTYDLEAIATQLQTLKKRWPKVESVTLSAGNSVEYAEITTSMDRIRKEIPVVILGGF